MCMCHMTTWKSCECLKSISKRLKVTFPNGLPTWQQFLSVMLQRWHRDNVANLQSDWDVFILFYVMSHTVLSNGIKAARYWVMRFNVTHISVIDITDAAATDWSLPVTAITTACSVNRIDSIRAYIFKYACWYDTIDHDFFVTEFWTRPF